MYDSLAEGEIRKRPFEHNALILSAMRKLFIDMERKAFDIEYSSPEIEITGAMGQKVICQSGEAPDFVEGWEIDF